MNLEMIKQANTQYIGKEILYYLEIESTHKKAEELAKKKSIKNGTLLIAEKQTAGIGTKGRSWYTGEENIAMTMVLYPNNNIESLKNLTIELAQAMKESIKELYGYDLIIKEPNDLLFHNKKISGILTQCASQEGKIRYLIISIGFNVNEEKFSKDIEKIATSLQKETNKLFSREEIIQKWIEKVEKMINTNF